MGDKRKIKRKVGIKELHSGSWSIPSLRTFPPAVKRMIAYQIEREMVRQGTNRARLARQMRTSRAAVNRLLDPENNSVTLKTLEQAATVLGKRLQIFFND